MFISNKEKLNFFMEEYFSQTYAIDKVWRVWDKKNDIIFEVSAFDGKIRLGFIGNIGEERKGNASLALDWLCSLADKHKVSISLGVDPIKSFVFKTGSKNSGLTKTQLKQWYEKRRFKSVSNKQNEMIRDFQILI